MPGGGARLGPAARHRVRPPAFWPLPLPPPEADWLEFELTRSLATRRLGNPRRACGCQ